MNPRKLASSSMASINAGKSSLINAVAGREARATGPIGGTTGDVVGVEWRESNPEVRSLPSASLSPWERAGVRVVAVE